MKAHFVAKKLIFQLKNSRSVQKTVCFVRKRILTTYKFWRVRRVTYILALILTTLKYFSSLMHFSQYPIIQDPPLRFKD